MGAYYYDQLFHQREIFSNLLKSLILKQRFLEVAFKIFLKNCLNCSYLAENTCKKGFFVSYFLHHFKHLEDYMGFKKIDHAPTFADFFLKDSMDKNRCLTRLIDIAESITNPAINL